MDVLADEKELPDMFERGVDLFGRRPHFQKIARLSLLGMEYDEEEVVTVEDFEMDNGVGTGLSYRREIMGTVTRSWTPVYQQPLNYYPSDSDCPELPDVNVKSKETDRKVGLLREKKKIANKAEKKRLKKQKQREKKELEQLEKDKQNPMGVAEQSEENEAVNDDKDRTNTSVEPSGSVDDVDSSSSSSSEDESSEEESIKDDSCAFEELDLTSSFVSKAALIAQRKLDQRPRSERKEKKKLPVKEESTAVPLKPNEEEVEKNSGTPTFEDNVKISTKLAEIGNKFASEGQYKIAVKYFTHAIKYNPTEFKLFGNRSFCFERMQEYEKALTDAELSLSMFPDWVKGLYRKGRALAGLKRYDEASRAFQAVLKLDGSCAEAAQELMRMQIMQLMEYGFTREQSSNALIIHGSMNKALEVLSNLNQQINIRNGTPPPTLVANATGTSQVLSANHGLPPPLAQDAPGKSKPLGPVQNMPYVQSPTKSIPKAATKPKDEDYQPSTRELFPVWVGNLVNPVTESLMHNMFSKAGAVHSVKLLSFKRCAFVNFTKQEYCDEAIRLFHGFALMGNKIAVRYPDRIPHGMGMSKSALKSDNLHDENFHQSAGGSYYRRPYGQNPDHRGYHQY